MRNRSFFARRVGFVEIMVPGFSRPVLEQLLPTLDESATGWGWGFDPLWAKLLDHQGLGILDAVPVLHTRPVGVMRNADLHRRWAANDGILDLRLPSQMVTFAGIGPDLQDMPLTQDELLVQLVHWAAPGQSGELLCWVVERQGAPSNWPRVPGPGSAAASPPGWRGLDEALP